MNIEQEIDEMKAMIARLTHAFENQFGTKEEDDGFGLDENGQKKVSKKRLDAAESRA